MPKRLSPDEPLDEGAWLRGTEEDGRDADTTWVHDEFAEIQLPDKRLEVRFMRVAAQLAAQPQAPINQASPGWADTKAAYRFFANDKVESQAILAAHQHQTCDRMAPHRRVLAVQDTTYLNYSTHPSTHGLGPIGDSLRDQQGLILHSTLVLTPEGMPLGLLTHELWARQDTTPRQRGSHKKQPIEEKESYKWLKALKQTVDLAPDPDRIITICDRDADVYEFLLEAVDQQVDFIVRASWNRGLLEATRLWECLQAQPVAGQLTLTIPARTEQPKREAIVEVRWARVTLRPPQRHRSVRSTNWSPLTVSAVWVHESEPPLEVTPLDWMLLSNMPVKSFEDAVQHVAWYKRRWGIEVWHKILKSGCRVEACRLGTASRLKRYVTLCSIIAWRLYLITQINRVMPEAPATVILSDEEMAALSAISARSKPKPVNSLTVRQAVRMIAQLGGFLGRKGDQEPGITAIWRGWQRLTDFTWMWSVANHESTYG